MNLKPPVTIEDLLKEWHEDATIDATEPAMESSRTPRLHSKYLHILTHHRILAEKYALTLSKTRATMANYYAGHLNSTEDLAKYGLEPWGNSSLNKDAIYNHVETSDAVADLEVEKREHDEIVNVCTSILKEINNRTYQLGHIVNWAKFTKGLD